MKEQILKLREEGKTYQQIIDIVGCSKSTVCYYCNPNAKYDTQSRTKRRRELIKQGLPTVDLEKKKSILWKCSREELLFAISVTETYTELIEYFGLKYVASTRKRLGERLEYENLIFTPKRKSGIKPFKDDEVFVENSSYKRGCLKKRIIENKYLEYKCSECPITNEWNGKKIVLVLDHKNGVHNDNRLENLRFLCPNCNSQQDTFAGRNKKYKKS